MSKQSSRRRCSPLSRKGREISDSEIRISSVFFALCKNIGTPVALGAWLRFKYNEHAQLASMTIRPSDYTSADAFHCDYIVVSYLSKYKGLRTNVSTEDVAVSAFNSAEEQCMSVNARLAQEPAGVPAVEAVISLAQRKISRVLGVLDPTSSEKGLTFTEYTNLCKWGPGSTFSLKGEDATVDNKMCEKHISVTPSALPYLRRVIAPDIHWVRSRGIEADGPTSLLDGEFSIVEGSRIVVVPKNAKTDRTIGVEPTGNLFLQLGAGRYIRRRLKKVGVDLDDQGRNRSLALCAVRRNLATVDLKMASDSINLQAVLQLLSPEWAQFLGAIRSPCYLLKGKWREFQKWSSMGNGYTFELESLIFWAISSSCADFLELAEAVSVYGDDIILPCEAVPLLRETLKHLGFVINEDKTFSTGLFRESCGIHVFDGHDVTPIYQKEIPNVLEEVHRLANRIGRLAYRMGAYTYLDSRLQSAHAACLNKVLIKYVVPLSSEDDDGFALPLEALAPYILSAIGRDVKLPVLVFRPKCREAPDKALLAYTLRFEPETDFNGHVSVRRRGTFASRRRWYHVGCDVTWI